MERDSCLVDVLLERGLVAHAEPGVQMATGRVSHCVEHSCTECDGKRRRFQRKEVEC